MMHVMERLTQPAFEPITLAEMKRHSKAFAEVTEEDPDFLELITAAREWVEDYTGRILVDQKWRQTMLDDGAPLVVVPPVVGANDLVLRRSPVLELLSVASLDSVGVATELSVSSFTVLEPTSKWPRLASVGGWSGNFRIEYRAGFADQQSSPVQGAEAVPKSFIRAMKLIAGHYYTHREPIIVGSISSELALTIKWLLFAQRAEKGFA